MLAKIETRTHFRDRNYEYCFPLHYGANPDFSFQAQSLFIYGQNDADTPNKHDLPHHSKHDLVKPPNLKRSAKKLIFKISSDFCCFYRNLRSDSSILDILREVLEYFNQNITSY